MITNGNGMKARRRYPCKRWRDGSLFPMRGFPPLSIHSQRESAAQLPGAPEVKAMEASTLTACPNTD
jgi:hypothetical protein